MATTHFQYHTELIDGQEIEKPLGKTLHARIQLKLILLILELIDRAVYEALPELNVLCNIDHRDRIVPDVTVCRIEDERKDDDLYASPALAVEIMSPGQTLSQLMEKCERLHRSGTPMCWIIWPEKRLAWKYPIDGHLESTYELTFETDREQITIHTTSLFTVLDNPKARS